MRFLLPVGLAVAALAAFLLLKTAAPVDDDGGLAPAAVRLVLSFPGATGWTEEPGCTDVDAADACDGEWTWTAGGERQKVRVLLVPVVDPGQLPLMTARLKERVEQQGGVVGEIEQRDGNVVRMLQPVVRAEDDVDLVNISYLLASPDRRLLHVVTSVVTQAQQVEADQRVRDLLAFAAWIENSAP